MKSVNVAFEDAEFEEIQQKKGSRTWREYILGTSVCHRCGCDKRE